jgi:hypothetical protein
LGSQVADQFVQSSHAKVLFDDILSLQQPFHQSDYDESNNQWQCRSSIFRQFRWLLWRTFVAHRRNPSRSTKLVLGVSIIAFIIGVVFFQLRSTEIDYEQNINAVLFFMLMGLVDMNMSLLLFGIPAERPLVIRECKRCTYSFTAYYLSRLINDTFTILITSVIYISIVVVLVGISHWPAIVSIVTLEVFAACGLASFMASLMTSPQVALTVLQPIQISLSQFSGYFINLNSLPLYIKWLQYLSHYYYAYTLLLIVQWRDVSCASIALSEGSKCILTGAEMLNYFGVDPSYFTRNIFLLVLMAIVFHIIAFLISTLRIRRAVR